MRASTNVLLALGFLIAAPACGGGGTGAGGSGGMAGTGGNDTNTTTGTDGTGGTGTTTSTSSTSGGSDATACFGCAAPLTNAGATCGAAYTACKADADCDKWHECLGHCMENDFTAACFDTCDTDHPTTASLWGAEKTCMCNACASPCAPLCN